MKTDVWLKIEGKKRYNNWGPGHVQAFKTKPACNDNEIAVKPNIEIPDTVFEEPVFECRLKLPDVKKELPEMSEVLRGTEKILSDKIGFRVRLSMAPLEEKATI